MLAPNGMAQFCCPCGVIVTKGGMDATDAKGVKVACQRE